MKILRNKLILSYSLISIVITLVIGVFLNLFINRIFEQYKLEQRNQQINQIIHQVEEQYDEETDQYNITGLEVIGNAALQNGIMIHVQSKNQEIDWNIKTHKEAECNRIMVKAEETMKHRFPQINGGYVEESYTLRQGGTVIGSLTTGYYGPYVFDDNEMNLFQTLNGIILFIAIIFLAVSAVLGAVIAKHITDPVKRAITIVNEITKKQYGIQAAANAHTLETSNLIAAINQMSLVLEKEERKKKQITADVAHELRTPLSNLQSHMEAMIDGIWEPSRSRLESCHAEILRLNKIVDDLRELNLLENSTEYLNKESFLFFDLCSEIFEEFALEAERKNIKLKMKIPEDSYVYADRNRLKQCVVNLVSNGVRYVPDEGTIEVRYQKDSKVTTISVSDNGPGIPKAEIENIFERFYRTDKSRNQKTGGMGIGLSITKAIIEAHQGSIHVKSQYGKGTTFIITLKNK